LRSNRDALTDAIERSSLLSEMTVSVTSVLIADAQPLFRDAVARTVRAHAALALAGVVQDGDAALRVIRDAAPAVAVLGVPLALVDGPAIARAVSRDGLATRVLLLLPEPDPLTAFDAIAEGAAGCLTRTVEPDRLTAAVRAVARGDVVIAPELQSGIAREIHARHGGHGPLLTAREREVLSWVADGRSTLQIARGLHLSPTTVKTHLGHAYEKLGVSDRAAAVAAGMRRGLLE
jgi:two-component system, NarL family, nitrate/nitrite response regulator NarL